MEVRLADLALSECQSRGDLPHLTTPLSLSLRKLSSDAERKDTFCVFSGPILHTGTDYPNCLVAAYGSSDLVTSRNMWSLKADDSGKTHNS